MSTNQIHGNQIWGLSERPDEPSMGGAFMWNILQDSSNEFLRDRVEDSDFTFDLLQGCLTCLLAGKLERVVARSYAVAFTPPVDYVTARYQVLVARFKSQELVVIPVFIWAWIKGKEIFIKLDDGQIHGGKFKGHIHFFAKLKEKEKKKRSTLITVHYVLDGNHVS